MGILRYLEYYLARLLINQRGRDAKLFTRHRLFADVPKSVVVTSPDLGDSPAHLTDEYTQYGASKFPSLSWTCPDGDGVVAEYVLICEDPDAPLPLVPNHGLYYAIPADKTSVTADDIRVAEEPRPSGDGAKHLAGGFRLGKNLRGTLYSAPRPPVGHGEHRYFFQVVAQREALDVTKMAPVATKQDLLREMEGKVVGWGEWIGVYEHKW